MLFKNIPTSSAVATIEPARRYKIKHFLIAVISDRIPADNFIGIHIT